MILSQFEEAVWHRRGSDCDIAEAWHHGGEIVSAIKAVLEFGEVAGYMFVADGKPSPVFFTIRPRCSAIFGSIRSRRWAFSRSCVPSSSAPMSREYPAT